MIKNNFFSDQIRKSSLFNQNKYSKLYFLLIEKALQRTEVPVYSEKHHILPKSLAPEFAKEKQNLAILSGREHFIAHILLAKCVKTEYRASMVWAISLMMGNNPKCHRRHVSSRTYEIGLKMLREEHSKRMTIFWADPAKRKEHSEKLKLILSTPESRALKKSAALKSSTAEVIAKRAAGHIGLKHSEATKQKMRESYQRRIKAA